MNLSDDISEEFLKFWRGRKIRCFGALAVGGSAGFLRLCSRLRCRRFCVLSTASFRYKFGSFRIPVIELGIENADFPQVAPLEGSKFGAQVDQRQLAVGEFGLQDVQFLTLPSKLLLFCRYVADDFGIRTRRLYIRVRNALYVIVRQGGTGLCFGMALFDCLAIPNS